MQAIFAFRKKHIRVMTVENIRSLFPVLSRKVYGKDLVYLDNAATSQRPVNVIDEWNRITAESNATIHRAVHRLADEATQAYEDASGNNIYNRYDRFR